jgi:hypothetical protein
LKEQDVFSRRSGTAQEVLPCASKTTQWSGESTYTPSGEEQNAALARAVIGGLSYLALLKSLAARRCGMLPETFIGKHVAEFLGW